MKQALVGLDEWVFLDRGEWAPESKRLRVGGVWAEATARPQKMVVEPGDGLRTVTCDGPGTAYDPDIPAAGQKPTCSVRYPRSSLGQGPEHAYRMTVTVVWSGTWRGSGGTGGALPPITRSVTFPVRVAEAQAVVTRG